MIGLMGGAVVSFRFSVFVHDWFDGFNDQIKHC